MPPYGACTSTWLSITSLSTSPLERTTAAAVSSHDVSMPSTVIARLKSTALVTTVQIEQRKAGTLFGSGVGRGQRRWLEQPQLDVAVAQQRNHGQHRALAGRVRPREEVFVVALAEAQGRNGVVVDLRNRAQRRAFEQGLPARRAQAGVGVVAAQD